MANKPMRYMTVNIVPGEGELMFVCWMSTVDSFNAEMDVFPHDYRRETIDANWRIHTSDLLTHKTISAAVDTADAIMAQQALVNSKRRAVNRR